MPSEQIKLENQSGSWRRRIGRFGSPTFGDPRASHEHAEELASTVPAVQAQEIVPNPFEPTDAIARS